MMLFIYGLVHLDCGFKIVVCPGYNRNLHPVVSEEYHFITIILRFAMTWRSGIVTLNHNCKKNFSCLIGEAYFI